MTTRACRVRAIQSASACGSGKSGSCSPITTRAGAATSASRASAGSWLVRVVRENAFAYPGRRRLATTWSRYSPKPMAAAPYSFSRYYLQDAAAHGGAVATRNRRCRIALVCRCGRTARPGPGRRPGRVAVRRPGPPPVPMELPTTTAGPAKCLDQGDDIGSRFLVAIGRERVVAVAVAAKVGAGHPVTRRPQGRSEETVAGPQVTHARHQHHQRAVARDVVADPSPRAAEIAACLDGSHGAGMASVCRLVPWDAHAPMPPV